MIKGNNGLYEIGDKVASAGKYQLHLCLQEQTGRQCLLLVANGIEHNASLDRAAFILKDLGQAASEIDAEAVAKGDAAAPYNYGIQFPEVVDSFISSDHEGRRVNIVAFRGVPEVSKLIPLSNITAKDRRRVDLRSSAWIMGKLLRLLSFTHSQSVSVNYVSGANVLIEIDNHYVVVFDWSLAQVHQGEIALDIRRRDIARAAKSVIVALGGNEDTGFIPDDGEEAFARYSEFLLRLSRGGESKADRAHQRFYEIVDAFWKREYYPFTTKPLVG